MGLGAQERRTVTYARLSSIAVGGGRDSLTHLLWKRVILEWNPHVRWQCLVHRHGSVQSAVAFSSDRLDAWRETRVAHVPGHPGPPGAVEMDARRSLRFCLPPAGRRLGRRTHLIDDGAAMRFYEMRRKSVKWCAQAGQQCRVDSCELVWVALDVEVPRGHNVRGFVVSLRCAVHCFPPRAVLLLLKLR